MNVKTKARRVATDPVDEMVRRMIFHATEDTHVDRRVLQVASLCLAAHMFDELVKSQGGQPAPEAIVQFSHQLTDVAAYSKQTLLKTIGQNTRGRRGAR